MHFYYAFLAIDFAFGTHGLVPGQQLKMLGLEACLVAFFAHPKDLKAFLMDIWGSSCNVIGNYCSRADLVAGPCPEHEQNCKVGDGGMETT